MPLRFLRMPKVLLHEMAAQKYATFLAESKFQQSSNSHSHPRLGPSGHGNNLTLNTTSQLNFSSTPTRLSSKDTCLSHGHVIQLYSVCTQGVLAFNINEPILG